MGYTVVDAAIGWMVQTFLGNLFTRQMEAWTREVGLAKDVENLKIEMGSVEMVLAAAKGRRFDNEPLARKLDELKELLYDAEDVMDELDYYRLQQHIEEGKGSSAAAAAANPEGLLLLSSTFQLVCSARDRISSWASHDRKRKREEEDPIHRTMLSLENKHDISKRIDGIVNHLRIIGNSVQSVLHLEISLLIATTKQSRSAVRNTRQTTSVPVECKVYGRDAERDMIIEQLVNGNSSDLHVLPIVGSGGFANRFVYRDQRIRSHFDLHIWVCVSTNFNEVSLTREMLDHVCKDSKEYEKISNFNVLQEILLENIRNKRFLLVLDDMWEDKDKSGWDKLLAPLKHTQVTGCMVLATTRRNSVARMILKVLESPNLTSLQLGSCTALVKLAISNCESLDSLNSLQPLGNLTNLEVCRCPRVQIGGYELCHRLERVLMDDPSALSTSFCEHLTSLQCLSIWECRMTIQLTDEQEEALQLLTSLRELIFGSCSNLVDLPAGLHSLPSLKELLILDCKGISRLPEKGLPPSLEQLTIVFCSEELNAHCRMLATSKLKVTIG